MWVKKGEGQVVVKEIFPRIGNYIVLEIKMYGTVLLLTDQKPTWIVQCRFAGQVEYYRINDPFEMQQMLNNILKVYVYGYIKDISYKLDPVTNS